MARLVKKAFPWWMHASPQRGTRPSGVLGDQEGLAASAHPQRGLMPGGTIGSSRPGASDYSLQPDGVDSEMTLDAEMGPSVLGRGNCADQKDADLDVLPM